MQIIGITGGVGSGKSTVLRYIEETWSLPVLCADDIGRAVQRRGEEGYRRIVEAFGREVVAEDGELDRPRLAKVIYEDDDKRKALEAIVHPLVRKRIEAEIAAAKERQVFCLLIESAILVEAGLDALCDELWLVRAELPVRIGRLMRDRGYTKERCEAIIRAQLPEEAFLRRCRVCIDNNADPSHTFAQIDRELNRLKEKEKV